MDINNITLQGRVVAEPTTKTFGETTLAEFRMVNNRKFGERERTVWATVKVWGRYSSVIEKYVSKGDKVVVSGELEVEEWGEDNKFKNIVIRANDVALDHAKRPDSAGEPKAGESSKEVNVEDEEVGIF